MLLLVLYPTRGEGEVVPHGRSTIMAAESRILNQVKCGQCM